MVDRQRRANKMRGGHLETKPAAPAESKTFPGYADEAAAMLAERFALVESDFRGQDPSSHAGYTQADVHRVLDR